MTAKYVHGLLRRVILHVEQHGATPKGFRQDEEELAHDHFKFLLENELVTGELNLSIDGLVQEILNPQITEKGRDFIEGLKAGKKEGGVGMPKIKNQKGRIMDRDEDIMRRILRHIQETGECLKVSDSQEQEKLDTNLTHIVDENLIDYTKTPVRTGDDQIVRHVDNPKVNPQGLKFLAAKPR